jgi:DNA topoisomerase I
MPICGKITGTEITAKHFRTWAGTVLAALALREFEAFDSAAKAKKNIRSAIEKVASRLGNTPTICRKCYIHPALITSYMKGSFVLEIRTKAESELREDIVGLTPEEAAVLVSLRVALDKATG